MPHLSLGCGNRREIGHDHGRPLESLEAQEGVADDRVGDSLVVLRHDVMRPQSRPPQHRALRVPPAERDHRNVARREARDAQPVDLVRDTVGDFTGRRAGYDTDRLVDHGLTDGGSSQATRRS